MAREPDFRADYLTLSKLRAAEPQFVATMVVSEHKGSPRPAHIHLGGDFTRKGDRVLPGVPRVLPGLQNQSPGTPADRLDLARWLVDRRNPLTARVAVNRIWQVYFGGGLVETDNDFGTQGSFPSHPELLDWLACELMDSDWSEKPIHRLIVSSATYRQALRHRADGQAKDPDNRLLWRQARLRLDAELIRDSAPCVQRIADDPNRRTECVPAPARGGHDAGSDEEALAGGRGCEPLPPGSVHLFLVRDAECVLDDVRRAGRRAVVHAAAAIEHTASGPDAIERPGLVRDRGGAGRADRQGTARACEGSGSARACVSALSGAGCVSERARDA